MAAKIVMDDGGGPVVGSIETLAATLTTLSNQSDVGVLGWQWTLRDRPAGSAAALSSLNLPSCTITPDLPGSYMIELITYLDAARTVFDGSDSQEIGIRFVGSFPWRLPAAGETIQFDPAAGWKPEVNDILDQIRTALLTGGGATKFHLRAGDNVTVLADFQYHAHGSIIIDAGASLTADPGAQIVVIP
jgi:hypothetical protein